MTRLIGIILVVVALVCFSIVAVPFFLGHAEPSMTDFVLVAVFTVCVLAGTVLFATAKKTKPSPAKGQPGPNPPKNMEG